MDAAQTTTPATNVSIHLECLTHWTMSISSPNSTARDFYRHGVCDECIDTIRRGLDEAESKAGEWQSRYEALVRAQVLRPQPWRRLQHLPFP